MRFEMRSTRMESPLMLPRAASTSAIDHAKPADIAARCPLQDQELHCRPAAGTRPGAPDPDGHEVFERLALSARREADIALRKSIRILCDRRRSERFTP
jgi:hypothetical protein